VVVLYSVILDNLLIYLFRFISHFYPIISPQLPPRANNGIPIRTGGRFDSALGGGVRADPSRQGLMNLMVCDLSMIGHFFDFFGSVGWLRECLL
jgi:hypothetical protein